MYAEIILPLYLNKEYTYAIPQELQAQAAVGKRVLVQFGKSKMYAGIIKNFTDKSPIGYEAKPILDILDEHPVVYEQQLSLWKWIADYYLCTLGEVMISAIPAALKLESTSAITLHPSYSDELHILSDSEYLIVEALHAVPRLEVKEVEKIVGTKTVLRLLKNMMDKQIIMMGQEVGNTDKSKRLVYVKLNDKYEGEAQLGILFNDLETRAPKQFEVLLHYINLTLNRKAESWVAKNKLIKIAQSTTAVFNQLIKKGIFTIIERADFEALPTNQSTNSSNTLSHTQQSALQEIVEHFTIRDVVLLHGVTSSGKTEVYIKLLEQCVRNNQQALFLLPEIALTTQMIHRLQHIFGEKLLVYHSMYNENERLLTWNKMLLYARQKSQHIFDYQIIIGARSAMFLPYSNLGLVIVDEEHEPSYKQHEPAPRYHARDSAMILARKFGAKVVLGSATPSVESYYNATVLGKYGLVEMNERYGNMKLPEINIIDLREEYKRKRMKSFFAESFLNAIGEAIKINEQVILFQNRRGFASFVQCKQCGWTPQCVNCDISLTYHKSPNTLSCHYCGYRTTLPQTCKACTSPQIETKGIGTERIEEEVQVFFPELKTARLDLDTSRSKTAYKKILADFGDGNTDVLVGTQMITKGLDFDNVSTVGIINADNMLHFPDFRANERSLQLMLQVSGRSGRKNKQGKVLVQTFRPDHPIFAFVIAHNYKGFFQNELRERKLFTFPPYARLISITLKHKNYKLLDDGAKYYARILKEQFAQRVLGPSIPAVGKINNLFLQNILLKIEPTASLSTVKKMISTLNNLFWANESFKYIIIHANVDPV